MISWIQKYFQKHFRVVFLLVLLAMAIPMVFIYNQSSGIGNAQRRAVSQQFFAHDLNSETDKAIIARDTQISSFLHQQNGDPIFRLTALATADQLHIPGPTAGELKDYVKTLPVFMNEKGEFDANEYNRFQANTRKANQEGLVRRVLEDDFRIGRVATLLGGPGYIQPQEVKNQLQRADTSWTLSVATVDYKAFSPTITPGDAELNTYFTANVDRYEIQPQVSVRYALFPAESYLDQVIVNEAELKAFFDANPARFAAPAKADDKKPAEAPSFDKVRLQVELAYKLQRATSLAAKAASEFALELYNKKINPGTPAFEEVIAARKLKLADLPPFSAEEPPAEFASSRDFVTQAFKLGKDQLVSDAIQLSNGAVVLFWKDTIPARKPEFAEVKAKVTADVVEEKKRERFVELGKTLRAQIEARLKVGDAFDKAATTAASSANVKVETKTFAPFTLRQPPQDMDRAAYGALEALEKGRVSEMQMNPMTEKGVLVYASDKKLPDLSENNPQYKQVELQIARTNAARNSAEYLREIAETEMAKNAPKTEQ
ncbi:MAG: peptidyl-prolyl cis-trans isomerase [Nibricoccus sp.]